MRNSFILRLRNIVGRLIQDLKAVIYSSSVSDNFSQKSSIVIMSKSESLLSYSSINLYTFQSSLFK